VLRQLLVRPDAFYGLLQAAATNAVEAATLLSEACDRYPERLDVAAAIHGRERRGDELLAELGRRIEQAFATPIDGRDLLAIGTALDRVVDAIDDVADELLLYRVASLPEQARAQARVLMYACERIADATARLARMPALHAELGDVRTLEEEGDRLRRDATAQLFHSGLDPLEIVRLKSVHEALERAIDECRAVADAMALVTIRHRW
jgi:uncharacterized protein Yka (UPF0111/DUF47 family)